MCEDWVVILVEFMFFVCVLFDCVFVYLKLFDGDCGGFLIDCFVYFL